MYEIAKSAEASKRAVQFIPGGVNSPVRSFRSVGGSPLYIKSAKSAYVEDIDGNSYVDYVASWGPMILGHSCEAVVEAVIKAAQRGTSFGAPTEAESELAELITRFVPSVDMVRLVNSGTEATMSALRLARGYTGKNLLVKFEGSYHGHGDSFLISAGSGAATLGIPNSPGVTKNTASETLVARYNDLSSVEEIFSKHGDNIAALFVEPVSGNMGVIAPDKGFLEGLRNITRKYGALLVFDEVMTGFRLARGGAQQLFDIKPDLTTFGKIIGGGLPVGAYGGKKEIMEMIAPSGPVYQAGTLSGNPLATAAGIAVLRTIESIPGFYQVMEEKSQRLHKGLLEVFQNARVPVTINRVGSMITTFFTQRKEVRNYNDVSSCDTEKYASFFHQLLSRGIYLSPSQFEASFVSYAHTDEDIDRTVKQVETVIKGGGY
ncbi:Glutamate-1-semialdehyde aminotransferase [Chitinispirillum alkaliphilum]|nr:Glutamate-1-semialdehyde aminotransferase [Chitinispirillum alkaliphilum]